MAWQRAQPLSCKDLLAALGIARGAKLPRGLALPLAPEVGEEVDDLAAFELGHVHPDAPDGRHHDRAVVPEVLRDAQRGRSAGKPVQRRPRRSPFAADPVALDAVLLGEEHLADLRVARLVEIVEEVEKGDQVAEFIVLKDGRVIRFSCILLSMTPAWFHMPAASSKNEPLTAVRPRSGPMRPPVPRTAWH